MVEGKAMRAAGGDAASPPARRRPPRRSAGLLHALLIDAAAAEFEAHGFRGATTAAIARRAGTTEAQLFRQFASKRALFRAAVFEPLIGQFDDFLRDHPAPISAADHAGIAAAYTDALQCFVAGHRRLLMALIAAEAHEREGGGGSGMIEELTGYFDRGAALMAARRSGDAGRDPRLVVRISFAAVLGAALLRDWLFPAGLASDDAIRAAVTRFVTEGAGGPS